LNADFNEIKENYTKALETAKSFNDSSLRYQLKVLKMLKDTQLTYGVNCDEINKTIKSINEIRKIKNEDSSESDDSNEDNDDEENPGDESISFSSDSDIDNHNDINYLDNDEIVVQDRQSKLKKTTNNSKKFMVKRNLRGETQLHVACIKGNFKMAKKLIEEGHPVNEREYCFFFHFI
jgi:hypothetical protein